MNLFQSENTEYQEFYEKINNNLYKFTNPQIIAIRKDEYKIKSPGKATFSCIGVDKKSLFCYNLCCSSMGVLCLLDGNINSILMKKEERVCQPLIS